MRNNLLFTGLILSYIDPGTGQAIYGALAPLLAGLAGFLILLLTFFRHWLFWLGRKIWNHKWPALAGVLGLAVTGAVLVYHFTHTDDTQTMAYKKVFLVGIDGLDPDICRKLLSRGVMPGLARLLESCSLHDLEIYNPAESPVSWSCIGCGVNPGKHGIFDFIHRNPETYLPRLSIAHPASKYSGTFTSDRSGIPFWRYTSDAGIPTTIVRWPVTTPPESITGNLLSGMGVPDIAGHLNSYRFYTSRPATWEESKNLQAITVSNKTFSATIPGPRNALGKPVVIPFSGSIAPDGSNVTFSIQGTTVYCAPGTFSDWITLSFKVGLMKKVSAICRLYVCSLPTGEGEALELYLSSPEIDPRNPALPITAPAAYAGELVDKLGLFHTLGIPEDINAAKVRHLPLEGFYDQCRAVEDERMRMFRYETGRFSNGVLAIVFDTSDRWQHIGWNPAEPGETNQPPGPAIVEYYTTHADRIFSEIVDLLDEDTAVIVFSDHGFSSYTRSFDMNAWLVEHGYMTVSADAAGSNSALFAHVDWSRTKAYSLGFTSIYLNMKDREGKGIVSSEDAAMLKNEIKQRLEAYRDPQTGICPIEEIYDGRQIYYGERLDEAPDLVIGFKPGYRMGPHTAVGGLAPAICEDNTEEWQGDHLIDARFVPGMFIANFPLIDRLPRTIDIAPTVLDCAGLDVPTVMDGVSLLASPAKK